MRLGVILLLFSISFSSSSQVFQQYLTDNSIIPDNIINTVYRSPNNIIWIGTEGGLVEVDTFGFWYLYNTDNSGLPDNAIRSIFVDNNEHLWVGTFLGGLAKYDGLDWNVWNTSNSGLPDDFIRCINQDAQDSLWIGTNAGLVRWDGAEDWFVYTILNSGLLSNNIADIHVDENDHLYLGTINGGLSTYIDGEIEYYRTENSFIADNTILQVEEDTSHNKWMATAFGGLSIFTPEGDFLNFNPINSDLPDWEVDGLTFDNDGLGLLAMASTGLVAFDGTDWIIWDMETSSIPTNHLKSVVVDNKNQIWIGTQEEGLLLLDRDAVEITVQASFEIQVYPNPASNQILVQLEESGQYAWQLRDVRGISIMNGSQTGNFLWLDVQTVPEGIYLLEVSSVQTGKISTQVVVTH